MTETSIRRFRDQDAEATARIFFDAVRLGTHDYYDAAQRQAWAPAVPATAEWRDRLSGQTVLVAERDGEVVGFMTMESDGRIDLAFVAPDSIGKGVAKQLYDRLLAEAVRLGMRRLHTEASHLARPFFERQGWTTIKRQTVRCRGVALINFLMEKTLS